jgi:glycosyltransferase involved in cell wall biosynthesis
MRVCYVIGTYPLVTTTFVDREIRSQRSLGVDIRVLAVRRPPDDAPLSPEQRDLQASVQYLLPVRVVALLRSHLSMFLRRPFTYVALLLRLVSLPHPGLRARGKTVLHFGEGVHAAVVLERGGFDELHAHFADRAATIALVASRLLDVPYSLSVHTGADVYVHPVLLGEKIRGARKVLTCTAYNRDHLAAELGDDVGGKIAVVPHGLELGAYQPVVGPTDGVPRILAVGQCRTRKGFAELIRACALLRAEGYTFVCRIVGDGPERGRLVSLAHDLGLAGVVQLPGALPHDEVKDEYRRATLLALPCVESSDGDIDGIPNVLVEAMACALPVVSTDLPAIRELITSGKDGLLVGPRDVAALADALATLLSEPERRRELGAHGRFTIAEMFDSAVAARRFAAELWPQVVPPEFVSGA